LNPKSKNPQNFFKLWCSGWIRNDGWWEYEQKQLSKSVFIFNLYVSWWCESTWTLVSQNLSFGWLSI